MKRIISLALLLGVGLVFWGCMDCISGKGEKITQQKSLEAFNQIILESSVDVILTQADSHYVELSGRENLVNNISLKNRGDKLIISNKNCVASSNNVTLNVFFVDLEQIDIEGSGDIRSGGLVKSPELDIHVDGSGDVKMTVYSDDLEVEINGSGDVELAGTSDLAELEIYGSGDINAYNLLLDECEIEISGSGNCNVNVQKKLKAEIDGSGTIHYKGRVKNVDSRLNGSGNISRRN